MAALTTYSRDLILAWFLTTGAATRPTAWYMQLHTGDPTVAGTENAVTVGIDADIVRKSVPFGTPSAGQDLNTAAASWTAASDATTHTVTHATFWDALTAGNCLLQAPLFVERIRESSGILTFSIGEIAALAR